MNLFDFSFGVRLAPVMMAVSKIALRIVPPILDAVDDGADRTEVASRVVKHLSAKGIGPASPQTVELFVMAFASLAFDLKQAEIAVPAPEVRRA